MNTALNLLNVSPSATGEQAYLYEISSTSTDALVALRTVTKLSFDRVWKNPEFTAAEMISAMGTNAKLNFERHAASIAFLISMGLEIPAAEYTPLKPYNVQENGTITLL